MLLDGVEQQRRLMAANASTEAPTPSSSPPPMTTAAPVSSNRRSRKQRNKRGGTPAPPVGPTDIFALPPTDVSDPFLYSVNVPYADREQLENLFFEKLPTAGDSRDQHVVSHVFLARGMWDARYMAGHPLDLLLEIEDLLVSTRRLVNRSVRVVVMMPHHAHLASMPELNMSRLQDRPFLKSIFRERWHAMWHQRCLGPRDMERLRLVTKCALYRATWRLRRLEQAVEEGDGDQEHGCRVREGAVYGLMDQAPRAEHQRRYRQKCRQTAGAVSASPIESALPAAGSQADTSSPHASAGPSDIIASGGGSQDAAGSTAQSSSSSSTSSHHAGGNETRHPGPDKWCEAHQLQYDQQLPSQNESSYKYYCSLIRPERTRKKMKARKEEVSMGGKERMPKLFDVFDITDETSSSLAGRFVDAQGHHYVDIALEALSAKLLNRHVCPRDLHDAPIHDEDDEEEAAWEAACSELLSPPWLEKVDDKQAQFTSAAAASGPEKLPQLLRLPDMMGFWGLFNHNTTTSSSSSSSRGRHTDDSFVVQYANTTFRYRAKVGCACHLPRYAALCELGGEKGMEMEVAEDRWIFTHKMVDLSEPTVNITESSRRGGGHAGLPLFLFPLSEIEAAVDSNRTTGGW